MHASLTNLSESAHILAIGGLAMLKLLVVQKMLYTAGQR
jgi:hypothetical protein